MKVALGSVITLAYDITDEGGEIIESSDISGPITFIQGKSGLISGLDRRLIGMSEGDEQTFEFPPEEAFGRVEDAPTRSLPRAEFPAGAALVVGTEFEAGLPGGQKITLRVKEFSDDTVTVQMIHPLAGQRISMGVKLLGVREATAAERESGQVMTKPPPAPPK